MANSTNWADKVKAVYEGQDPGRVVWQPRLEFWYRANKIMGTLPERFRDAELLDVYDYCHASVRYFGNGLRQRYKNVQYTETWDDPRTLRRTWDTPIGVLEDIRRYDELKTTAHNAEYKVKTLADLKILEYMLQDEEWYWDQEAHLQSMACVGQRGIPQFYSRRSPIQQLFIRDVGFERTIYMMYDEREVIAHYVGVATEADDQMYDVICKCPVPVFNLGDNVDSHLDSPSIWKQHLAPYYRKRTEQLHAAGKHVAIHVDGTMKPLLPYMRDVPWDAIEAATPVPQGDVTLEQIKDALGDLILLDGIPALLFLSSFAEQELVDCTNRIVELFYPRLILGISDEISPIGDIERVRLVGELVQTLAG